VTMSFSCWWFFEGRQGSARTLATARRKVRPTRLTEGERTAVRRAIGRNEVRSIRGHVHRRKFTVPSAGDDCRGS